MRLLIWIFSLYICTLACLPCSDENILDKNPSTHISTTDAHHTCNGAEECTPFCTCACCGSLLIATSIQHYPLSKRFTVTNQIIYYTDFPLLDLSYTIWQPPKA